MSNLPPPTPRVMAVEPGIGLKMRVTWEQHGTELVNLAPWIAQWEALKIAFQEDPDLFARARVGEFGWSVVWNEEIEIDSTHLYRLARYQARESLEPQAFQAWRARHGLSQAKAAESLGLSSRMVKYYESGHYLIPKTVMLACTGYDAIRTACSSNGETGAPPPLTHPGTPR